MVQQKSNSEWQIVFSFYNNFVKSPSRKLFSQLEQVIQTTASLGHTPENLSESGKVVYELRYNPQQMKFENASKVSDLQKRLDKLEAILGANVENMVHESSFFIHYIV